MLAHRFDESMTMDARADGGILRPPTTRVDPEEPLMIDPEPEIFTPAAPAAADIPGRTPTTSGLAVIAFVGSFFISLVGIICGHIALDKIKRTGDSGRGLAIAALWIGYGWVVIYFVVAIVLAVLASAGVKVGATIDEHTIAKSIAVSNCAQVTDAAKKFQPDLQAALRESSTALEKSQTDTWNATGAFKDATVDMQDKQVRAAIRDVDAALDGLNTAFAALMATAPAQRDPAALDAAINDINTAWATLVETCRTATK